MAQPQATRVSRAAIEKAPPPLSGRISRLRSFLFSVGDSLFLITVGILAVTAMRLIDALAWHPAPTWVVGMGLAMLVQTLLAFAVAPILGSIESMVPSMPVAMICPMALELLEMIGLDLEWSGAVGFGAAFGFGMSLFVVAYGFACKKSLRRASCLR